MEAVTINEWREQRLPHFTAREADLLRYFRREVESAAELFQLDANAFTISSRIKEADSAARTAQRRSKDFWLLEDWVGLRVACPTQESAYHVSISINSRPDWQPTMRLDYNQQPKLNGYRGIHLYGTFAEGSTAHGKANCEIQILTRLQALWSELTHNEIYKPSAIVSGIARDTSVTLASYMAATDNLIETLFRVAKSPEAELRGDERAKTKHWIAVLSKLDNSFDRETIERLRALLESRGIKTGADLEALERRFGRSFSNITSAWRKRGRTSPTRFQCVDIAARLWQERIPRDNEQRLLREWAEDEATMDQQQVDHVGHEAEQRHVP